MQNIQKMIRKTIPQGYFPLISLIHLEKRNERTNSHQAVFLYSKEVLWQ